MRDRPARPIAAVMLLLVLGSIPNLAETSVLSRGHVVPSSRCRGLFIIPVAYGDATLDLVLDTGAFPTSLDPDAVARVLGRRPEAGKTVKLADGSAGPLKLRRLSARAHEMDHLGRALGRPIDGILGVSAFKNLLLTLDYPAGEVHVGEGALPMPDGHRVFGDVGRRRPYLAIEIAGTKRPVLIDSGSTGGLTLRTEDDLEWTEPPRPVSASMRYSGPELNEAGRLGFDVPFGPLTIERPIVRLGEGSRLAGFEILRHFVWTFDLRNRRMRLLPDEERPIRIPPERGTGLALSPTSEGFEVLHVLPDTPAAAAGLRPGDVVVAVEGRPVHDRGCEPVIDPATAPRARLSVRRDGVEHEIAVEFAVLVP